MEYSFVLVLREHMSDSMADRIMAVCQDCTPSISNGESLVDFDREANNKKDAIDSAILQLKTLGLHVTEVRDEL